MDESTILEGETRTRLENLRALIPCMELDAINKPFRYDL